MYLARMNLGVWIGASTTLLGALLGGTISLVLSRQQIKAGRERQEADRANEKYQRNIERRFQVYSDYLIRSRSLRNALKAYYLSEAAPSLDTIDEFLRSAQDTAALVFLVVETDEVYKACIDVLRALGDAQAIVHGVKSPADPWRNLNLDLGRSIRSFQVAARHELEVSGPSHPWGERDAADRLAAEPDSPEA
jgi:hypothetical protein